MGARGGYEDKSRYILYTRHIVTTSSTEQYKLMKIFLTVFKIEGIVALTIKESIKMRVVILECDAHHDLLYITVKYHDYIPNGFHAMEQTQNCT